MYWEAQNEAQKLQIGSILWVTKEKNELAALFSLLWHRITNWVLCL